MQDIVVADLVAEFEDLLTSVLSNALESVRQETQYWKERYVDYTSEAYQNAVEIYKELPQDEKERVKDMLSYARDVKDVLITITYLTPDEDAIMEFVDSCSQLAELLGYQVNIRALYRILSQKC